MIMNNNELTDMKKNNVKKYKKVSVIKKVILSVVIGIFVLAGILFAIYKLALDPYRGVNRSTVESLPLDDVITVEQAIEDMDYVMEMYRDRHPAWLEDSNERVDAVEAMYESEVQNLRNSGEYGITVLEEWKAISRIMHLLYDGHSSVYSVSDSMLYIDDFSQLREIGRPVKINGEPYEAVLERFCNVFQYEMESYARAVFDSNVICNENYLRWSDVDTSEGLDLTYDMGDGTEETFHYEFVPIDEVKGYDSSTEGDAAPWVCYDIDRENGIGIFTLTSCNYNKEYKETVKEFFEAVNEAGVDNVIVDLRWNGGGSSMVGDEFVHYLDVDSYYGWPSHVRFGPILYKNDRPLIRNHIQNPVFDGNVYILTNKQTFSAAMDFTMIVMDNGLGTVVGEECGNLPDSYGDILTFDTPNSHLTFTISYKRWFRVDADKTGQPLTPDYPCPSEEALDKAYELILGK